MTRTYDELQQELSDINQEITWRHQQRAELDREESALQARRANVLDQLARLGSPAMGSTLAPARALTPAEWREEYLASPSATYHGALVQQCKGPRCGARIAKAVTKRGSLMPVDLDADGRPTGSHFATCVDAARFRRKP